jgi:hypothetical protein
LLNFSVESVRRIGGRIYEKESAKGRSASLRRMDTWLGGQWWRPIFLDSALRNNPARVAIAADTVYGAYLRRINAAANSRSFSIPIRKQPHHAPIFYLTLFYLRDYAVIPFNDASSAATREWREHLHDIDLTRADLIEFRNPPLPGLSRVTELQDVFRADEIAFEVGTTDDILQSIRMAIQSRRSLSVTTDFELIFGRAIGVANTSHLRSAWKQLAQEGLVMPPPTGRLDRATIWRRET